MKYIFIVFLAIISLNVNGQYIRAKSETNYALITQDPQVGTFTTGDGVTYPLFYQ